MARTVSKMGTPMASRGNKSAAAVVFGSPTREGSWPLQAEQRTEPGAIAEFVQRARDNRVARAQSRPGSGVAMFELHLPLLQSLSARERQFSSQRKCSGESSRAP